MEDGLVHPAVGPIVSVPEQRDPRAHRVFRFLAYRQATTSSVSEGKRTVPTRPKERSLARSVIGGVGLIAGAGAVNKLFALLAAPVLTVALGPAPYGVVALLTTVTSLGTLFALAGVDMSYARFYFSESPTEGQAVERFCWRFTLVASLPISVISLVCWWYGSEKVGLPASLAPMVCAGIFLAALSTMAATRQRLREGYLRIAIGSVTTGLVGVALSIVLALYWRKDAWSLLLGGVVGMVSGILVLGLPRPSDLARPSGLPPHRRWEVLRLGAAGAAMAPLYWLMNSADRWIIGAWAGQDSVGVYAFAAGIGQVGILLNSAITYAWFPEMSRAYEASREEAPAAIGRMWGRLVAGLMVAWVAVTAAGPDAIRLLADPRFYGGGSYVPWMAGGMFFYGVASLSNTGHLLRKDLRPAVGWWTAGAIMDVGLTVLLVIRYGAAGAAIAACSSFAFIAGGVMWSSQRRYCLAVPWGRLAAAALVAVLAGVSLFPPWASSPFSSLLRKLPVGLAVGCLLFWVVAPDWMCRLVRRAPEVGPDAGA